MTQPGDWWELTNGQRRCFGIVPVEAGWQRRHLPRSPYDNYDTVMYLDGSHVRYVVQHGESHHQEYAVDEVISEDGAFILPKRSVKPIRLSAATLSKRSPVGMRLCWWKQPRGSGYCALGSDSSRQRFWASWQSGDAVDTLEDLRRWAERWCAETNEADQREIDAFAACPLKTVKHREGDVFRFRWNRRLWGYGRILLDYDRMRREKIPFFDCLMTRPVAVQIFKIVTEDRDLSVEQVLAAEAIPSQNMMDDPLHYGEFEIIGHAPLPENRDALCPVMYGVGCGGERLLRFQQGRIYRELPGEEPVDSRKYMNSAVGRNIAVSLPQMLACIEGGDDAYWALVGERRREDVRHPGCAEDFAAIRRQVGL